MKNLANSRFTIKSWNEEPYGEVEGLPKLTRATVTKTFTGDIAGDRGEDTVFRLAHAVRTGQWLANATSRGGFGTLEAAGDPANPTIHLS